MTIVRRPKVTLNIIPAALSVGTAPHKVLFIGQMTSGTATAGTLVENIQNDKSENTLFGAKSMLAGMIRAAKNINKITRMDAIALADNGSGVAAAGAIAFSGTATEDGTFFITIGSTSNHKYEIAITTGDTATDIGDKLEDAITADSYVPVTAANTTGSVAITAVNKGIEGNEIGLRIENTVAGITTSITAMASGATNPSLTGLFDVIEGERYQTIVWPSSYTLSDITDFLRNRFNVTNNVLDGVAITTKIDTYTNLVALGDVLNSQSLVIFGNRKLSDSLFKGPSCLELNNVISAQFAAIRALRLTENANLSNYVIATRGAKDNFGGDHLGSLPYFNTPLYNLPIIPVAKGFTEEEIEDLGEAGISVFGNNRTRTNIILADVFTTYKTDAAGNEDKSYKYLNYVDSISIIREYMVNNARSRFAQSRLSEGVLIPGYNMANEDLIRAFFIEMYSALSGPGYVLTQAGDDALDYYKDNLDVTLNLVDGLVTVNQVTPIVTQFRNLLGTIQLSFSVQS